MQKYRTVGAQNFVPVALANGGAGARPAPTIVAIVFLLFSLTASPFCASTSNVVRDFSPVNHSPVNHGAQYIVDGYEVSSGYLLLGKTFDYGTPFGRVTVNAKGTTEKVAVKIFHNTEISARYFNFFVDSYFANSQVGNAKPSAILLSAKTIFPTKPVRARCNVPLPSLPKFGYQYKFLSSNSISPIHFIDFFSTASFGTVESTAGLISYFGKDVDAEFGGFVNMNYLIGDSFNFFVEYNSLDFMKAVQNYLIAPSAKNVGIINTSNAPKDAFSLGFSLRLEEKLIARFIIYDLALQMKPFVEIGLLK